MLAATLTLRQHCAGASQEGTLSISCDVKTGCHCIWQYSQGMTELCRCSHPIQMPHKGAGVPVLLVHSREQLTPLPLGLFFSSDHILHQEQCYVLMQQPLAVMHQTLGLVPIEVVTTYNYDKSWCDSEPVEL